MSRPVNPECGPTGSYEIPTRWRDEDMLVVIGSYSAPEDDRIYYEEIKAMYYRRLAMCDSTDLVDLGIECEGRDDDEETVKRALCSFVRDVFYKNAWDSFHKVQTQTFRPWPKSTHLKDAYATLSRKVWAYVEKCFPRSGDAPFTIFRDRNTNEAAILPTSWFTRTQAPQAQRWSTRSHPDGQHRHLLDPWDCLDYLQFLPESKVSFLYEIYSLRHEPTAWSANFGIWWDYVTPDYRVKDSSKGDAVDPDDLEALDRKNLQFAGALARFMSDRFQGKIDLAAERDEALEPHVDSDEESDSD